MPDAVTILQKTEPFSSLDPKIWEGAGLRFRRYPAGTCIARQGAPARNYLFIVAEGKVEITVAGSDGNKTVVGYREPGQFFGSTALLSREKYPASARAVTEVTCLLFPRQVLSTLLQEHPQFASYFSRNLAERLRELYSVVVAEQTFDAYHADNLLFRKPVGEIMSSPIITCQARDPITAVGQIMSRHHIGAVLVMEGDRCRGLISERDLVNKVIARGGHPEGMTAAEVMNTRAVTVPAASTVGDVFLALSRTPAKYVMVTKENAPAGIVSVSDLVKTRTTGTLFTAEEIEHQESITGLAAIGHSVDRVLQALVAEKASVQQIFAIMTTLHDRLTKKVIEISLEEMAREGHGEPPVPWCWLNLGSSGRQEQTLRTDQDNAVIYQDPEPQAAELVKDYFTRLGAKVVRGLEQCGFARCRGDVMANNPSWCHSAAAWQQIVANWLKDPEPQNVRYLTILLDFRPVYGETRLAKGLRHHVFTLFTSTGACRILAEDDLQSRVPLGLLGQPAPARWGRHRGQINLKNSVCVHIVDGVRIFSLEAGIEANATLDRLAELARLNILPPAQTELWQAAFEILMNLRIRENLRQAMRGHKPDNYVDLRQLNRYERAMLKEAMAATAGLQETLERHFAISI
ncbi:MAG: cyclic nucleotide-binding domain-containing protein [Clostridia bacterium]|nr:MAG: cyclic nucleotide-binding domain-containing protein [Clostridia bacterium]